MSDVVYTTTINHSVDLEYELDRDHRSVRYLSHVSEEATADLLQRSIHLRLGEGERHVIDLGKISYRDTDSTDVNRVVPIAIDARCKQDE